MTTAEVSALLGKVRDATVYDLEQPRFAGAPIFGAHRPGFVYALHRRHEPGLGEARTSASGLIVTAEHSGTHIDALCHQAEDLNMFGGIRADGKVQTSAGFTELGAETIGPLIARGILLDVARHRGVELLPAGELVGAKDLQATAAAQQVAVQPGDVVLVRTGTGALWRDPDTYLAGAGMSAEASDWLAGEGVLAVGADNVAWDAATPADPQHGTLPGHLILIVRNGIYIIENLLLEDLATEGQNEFLFICLPLKMVGVTGSPVRPLAVVPT
jgi:kynurenine formamidase